MSVVILATDKYVGLQGEPTVDMSW